MATSNSRPHPLQSQNPFSYILVMFIAFFLLLLNKVNSSDTLCFTFTKFVPNQEDLLLQGDALVSSSTGKLQLTKVENDKPISSSVGRVLHATPVHIWDNTTSRVASFHTSFSFVVKTPQAAKPADGIAFFFAPPDSQIQSSGGYLGLFSDKFYNGSNHIVAVEFDTYSNPWDPVSPHIGIDVNSIVSQKTVAWGWRNGEVANVVISYESAKKTLTTCVTYPASQTSYILSAAVDVKSVLPEWVRVGFSATTGLSKYFVETHDVLSWSFSSTLQSTTGSNNNNCAKENNVLIAPYE